MTAPVDVIDQLDTALTTGTREAFTALLTHDVRWGGEHPGGDHECTNRDQAGDHYEGLLAAGMTIQLAALQQIDPDDANKFIAQLQISSPDADDFPPVMAVRLTLRDGLICDITILDQPPTIEVLYYDGCPHHEAFLPHLHDILHTHGITTPVTLIRIDNDDDAQTHHFLGSPTVRIDGHDIDPNATDPNATDHRPPIQRSSRRLDQSLRNAVPPLPHSRRHRRHPQRPMDPRRAHPFARPTQPVTSWTRVTVAV